MSLEYILLGMLRDPASGYELRNDFGSGPRHFWSAELGQIYPTLQRMEKRGWLASREEPSSRGPARRVYRRTAAGSRALRQWLRSPPEVGAERLAHIGQLVFMGELRDLERTLGFLQALRDEMAALHAALKEAENELRAAQPDPPEQWNDYSFHELLCLRLGVRAYRARAVACEECIRLVKSRFASKEHAHV